MIAPKAVEAVRSELAAHLRSRSEWDEQPALFTIHQVHGPGVRMIQVPVPEQVWTTFGHPPTAVVVIADMALGLPRRPDGSHVFVMPDVGPLIGAAFRYEAYAISGDADHPAAREAARRRNAGGSTPRFEHIPGRVEQRCINAVDTDGGRYMASSNRIDESKPDAAEPNVHYLAFADPKRDTLTGNVVDATNRFLNAIKPAPAKGPTR
ncbi:hypothetical protein PV360_37105 [Streptomyces scabiei]|uniref:hypothetical protein n=1 Tax=Streptomyces scabiei TaxID=1930 RepID=UPI0005A1B39E|nr:MULTISPECIES: hypothetical protein [Streptomyces]MBP5875683.1 hypothetical protein [Streptomyces sp. LBUM 1477]MDX2652140.1 hypothetical protein [Streptomyces scabiei]MDX2725834.1 hypothetical protein [Streptomyces scabiei]MDX2863953.1 hypothetical protein [Streptomyces scabiei]MDX2881877.1 hypothetical protein [Streptomyces scabiei]